MKKNVLHSKYRKARFNFWETIIMVIAFDYYNAPGWLWGAVGALWIILQIGILYLGSDQNECTLTELLEEEKAGKEAKI